MKGASPGGPTTLWVVTFAALAVAAVSFALYLSGRPPGDRSAEAGFARDMIVHHSQAVEMAGIIQNKTRDERIRTLATDIALTQQAQIGQMQGWLAVWGLPATGSEPAMSWMGHPTEGLMPGMAAQEEINDLRDASPEEADRQFLRLMIPHHKAAVPMAEGILERTERPEVRRLASAIVSSQKAEIRIMQDMLKERDAKPATEDTPMQTGGHHH